jgi:hypothetical protein
LGATKAGPVLETPFVLEEGRQIRISVVSRTELGVESVNNIDNAETVVFPSGPTFTSAIFDTVGLDIDLVFVKNSAATGDIQVEYRKVGEAVWNTHATDFAHSATSGNITIAQEATAQNYELRLKQDGVDGYSVTLTVTVSGSGGGAGTPPTNLDYTLTETGDCTYDVELSWTAGSGAGNYTIERKLGSGSWIVRTSSEAASPWTDEVSGSPTVVRTYYYRVKQNDIDGYSNQITVYIDRCTDL